MGGDYPSYRGTGNLLILEDGALLMVEGSFIDNGDDNFLRLDGGYLALNGNLTAETSSLFAFTQVWDGFPWVSANSENIQFTYFSLDQFELAESVTGYEDLGGYAVITSVPEPGTWALLSRVIAC